MAGTSKTSRKKYTIVEKLELGKLCKKYKIDYENHEEKEYWDPKRKKACSLKKKVKRKYLYQKQLRTDH